MSVKIVIAHHPYEAQREDEISFDKDEVIKVTDFSDPDWWVGKKKDGSLGFFPSNFVHEKEETMEEQPKEETEQVEQDVDKENIPPTLSQEEQEEPVEEQSPVEEKKDQVIGMARVMEDYAMNESGELSLHRGGIINVYEVIDEEWSRGELNGKVGKYPSKYVEDIDMPGRPDLGKQHSISSDVQKGEEETAPKGGFKLAAFGVKQGGIGSLLAGGFPGLKKTGAAKSVATEEPKPVEPEVKPEPTPEPVKEEEVAAPVQTEEQKPKSLGKAIVLHPYDAESEDELSLLRGEYVEILDRDIDDGWWKGLNERGQSGVFPNNFVRELGEESIAPPTPTRARRSVQSVTSPTAVPPPVPDNRSPSLNSMARPPQVPRPASVQTPSTTRPISVQPTAQRPSSISHTTSSTTAPLAHPPRIPTGTPPQQVASPSIIEESKEEEIQDEREVKSPVESIEKVVESPPAAVDSPAPAESPAAVEKLESPPAVIERAVPSPPVAVERVQSPPVDVERVQSPHVAVEREPSPPDVERKASVLSEESVATSPPTVERKASVMSEESIVSPPAVEPTPTLLTEDIKSPPVVKEDPISDQEEKESGAEDLPLSTIATRDIKPIEQEEEKKEESQSVEKEDEEKKEESQLVEEEDEEEKEEDEFKDAEEHEEEKEEVVEEKNEFGILPTGPKLTTPARARIGGGRARRSPQTPSQEPSQIEILQKELEQEPEEEPKKEEEEHKSAPSPPAKPVKPIFAKFPTPFATGGAISKTHLKPTQTRKLWDDKPEEKAPSAAEEELQPVRPSGVKNIASRFNFAGNNTSGGSNEVLETKLKNHTKNEVEKVRKEFEQLLQEEKEKRLALEETVQLLMEKIHTLELS